jgi:hypothetical protein
MLTPAQYPALKAHIAANTTTIPYGDGPPIAINALPLDADAAEAIKDWYNGVAVPDFWVWRTAIAKAEMVQQPSRTGTNFTWAGNGFITRSAGELAAWQELFGGAGLGAGACNPALPNVRQAFADIFSGAGNAALNRTHLDVVARRKATNTEKLYATGTGADTNAGAGTMTFEGALTGPDVANARNS